MQEVAQTFGGVDILVNNAGISAREPLADYSPEAFRSIMDLNVTAVFHGCKAVEPIMRAAGKGASQHQLHGQPLWSAERRRLSRQQICRQRPDTQPRPGAWPCGHPRQCGRAGVTRTDMVAALPQELIDRISAPIPLGRIG